MAKKKNVANRPSPSDDEQQNSTAGGNASTSFPRGSPEWKPVVSKVTLFVAEPGSDFSTEPFSFWVASMEHPW